MWKSIRVRESTKSFLEQLKNEKGFQSLDELIKAMAKACQLWTKGQIYVLAEMHVKTAPESKLKEKIDEEFGGNYNPIKSPWKDEK